MRNQSTQSGFTIVELLIAAAITIGIVAMLGGMFVSLSKTTSRASASIDAFRDARAALHMIERDFSAVVVAAPTAYFAIDTDSAGNGGAAIRQIEALVSAKSQSTNTNAPLGDLCAVRYYSAWDATARAYVLKRYYRDSKNTFQVLTSVYPGNGYVDVNNLYCANVANCAITPTADEPLASYVWSLRATAYDSSGNVINQMTDNMNNVTTSAQYICNPSATTTGTLPAAIEVSFKAMSPAAAKTVIAATSGRSDGYNVWMAGDNPGSSGDTTLYNRLIAPNTYVFRTRIDLH